MNLYDVLNKLSNIASNHKLIGAYHNGDVYRIMNSAKNTYPVVVFTVDSLQNYQDYSTLNAYMYFIDRLTDDEDNKINIQTNGINVINDIINKLCEINEISVPTPLQYTFFTEKFGDMCCGVYANVSIQFNNYSNCCENFNINTLDINENGEYILDNIDVVTVNVQPELQNKTVEYTENGEYSVTNDEEFYGLKEVKINVAIPNVSTAVTITENGTTTLIPDSGYYNQVDINVQVPDPELETKTVNITQNGTTNIEPDSKYGLSNVTVNTNVQPTLQNKTVTITENGTQTITKDDGYDGLGNVTVTTNVAGGGGSVTTARPTFTSNGKYYPSDFGVDYFEDVFVNVINHQDGYVVLDCSNFAMTDNTIEQVQESKLKYLLDLSCIDTSEKTSVVLGDSISGYTAIKASGWDLRNVTGLSDVLISSDGTTNLKRTLKYIDFSNWDVSNITSMVSALEGTNVCEYANLQNWKLNENGVDCSYFCQNLGNSGIKNFILDLRGWKFENITNMNRFAYKSEFYKTYLPSVINLENCTSIGYAFYGGSSHYNDDEKITIYYGNKLNNASNCFEDLGALTECTFIPLDFSNSQYIDADYMFYKTYDLKRVDMHNVKFSSIKGIFNTTNTNYSPNLEWIDWSNTELNYTGSTTQSAITDNMIVKTVIGDHTLEEVENNEVVIFKNFGNYGGSGKKSIYFIGKNLRYSSLLALAKGIGNNNSSTLSNIWLSNKAWDNMRNDDDTIPDSNTITHRQNIIRDLIISKNYRIMYR